MPYEARKNRLKYSDRLPGSFFFVPLYTNPSAWSLEASLKQHVRYRNPIGHEHQHD
jgi:hypothetical protein